MSTHAEKLPEKKSNSVVQGKAHKAGVGIEDNRQEATLQMKVKKMSENYTTNISKFNGVSKSSIQLMAMGGQEESIMEKRAELSKITPSSMISEPAEEDLIDADNELLDLRNRIEQAVTSDKLVEQPHGWNMAELRARFHNDEVYRRFRRGSVDGGHEQRTSDLFAECRRRKALEKTKSKADASRAAIQNEIVQL